MLKRTVGVLGLVIWLAAGCGTVPVVPMAERPEYQAMTTGAEDPIPGKVMLAPVTAGYDRESELNSRPTGMYFWIPELDSAGETGALFEALRGLKVFSTVLVSKLPAGDISRDNVIKEGQERGFDFVLYPEMKDYRVSFVRHASSHVGNMFLWFTTWIPSWFVHDEVFGGRAELDMSLIDVYSQKDVLKKTYAVAFERPLNSFERGWLFYGVWRIPGSLDMDNWQSVANTLLPGIMNDLKIKFLQDYREGVVKSISRSDDFKQAVTKTVVLAVGVRGYSSGQITPVPYADQDASVFFKTLENSGKAIDGYSKLLVDGMAGKQDILDALASLAKLTRESDILVFYFSGYGASLSDADGSFKPFLIPYDAIPEKLAETAISIDEIMKVTTAAGAGEVVLVLDTAFGADIRGKTLTGSSAGAGSYLEEIVGSKTVILAAADSRQGANAINELNHGLFTYYIFDAVQGENGDSNRDGLITMKESFLYAANKVQSSAVFRGGTQTPKWYGKADLRLILTGSDKDQAMERIRALLGAETVEELELK